MTKQVRMKIYCCGCEREISARLTSGKEIYPSRQDLYSIPFWKCDHCGQHVGCHHKTNQPTRPLGNIPTPAIRNARKHIHALIDPLWQSGKIKRGSLYARIGDRIGCIYHTGEIKTIDEARRVYRVVQGIARELHDAKQ